MSAPTVIIRLIEQRLWNRTSCKITVSLPRKTEWDLLQRISK